MDLTFFSFQIQRLLVLEWIFFETSPNSDHTKICGARMSAFKKGCKSPHHIVLTSCHLDRSLKLSGTSFFLFSVVLNCVIETQKCLIMMAANHFSVRWVKMSGLFWRGDGTLLACSLVFISQCRNTAVTSHKRCKVMH